MHVARRIIIITSTEENGKRLFLSRAELLEIMERHYPELYYELPKSKRGLANWWKESKLTSLKQWRGNVKKSGAWGVYLKQLKEEPYLWFKPGN